ncbi:YhdP family protein [Robiginitomaculum antarcticum]|uniref:YhdP family protein n=1 Tax=Robiginitomaculum antarcticum TaxID=437507 RepID=UPI00037C4CCD|nr:AsmA-like C-terminal domain-containing protein [Robiginitomaculum antarcticum]
MEDASTPRIDAATGGDSKAGRLWGAYTRHQMNLAAKTRAARKYDGSPNTRLYRIGRPLLGFGVELLTILLGAIFVWFNVLFFFMRAETVDLSPFKSTAQSLLSERYNGQSANLDSLRIEWFRDEQALGFVARNLTIYDKAGEAVTNAGTMNAKFGLRSLIIGSPVITEAELTGGSLTVIRRSDRTVMVGLGAPANADAFSRDVSNVQPINAAPKPGQTRKWRSIKSLRLREGQIYLIDEVEGINWRLDSVNLDYLSKNDVISLDMSSDIASNGQITPLGISGVANNALTQFEIKVNTAEFYPAKLIPTQGRFAAISTLDAPVALDADIRATDTGLTRAEIGFSAGAGRIKAGQEWRSFDSARFTAGYDVLEEALRLSDIEVKSDLITLSGLMNLGDLGDPESGFFKRPVRFDAVLEDVVINPGPRFAEQIRLPDASATGQYDTQNPRVILDALAINFGAYNGAFIGNIGFGNSDKPLTDIILKGEIGGDVNPAVILKHWPVDFALGARNWVERALLSGDISQLKLDVSIEEDDLERGILQDEDLDLTFNFDNANVKYISTMTPLEDASGFARLQGNQFSLTTTQGRIGSALTLTGGQVDIPRLNPKGGDFTIMIEGEGQVPDLLHLIDEKPFEFMSKAGIDPSGFTGFGSVKVNVKRPLLESFEQDRLDYSATGEFSDVSAPIKFGDYALADGRISLNVDKTQMAISGPVSIGPWQADLSYLDLFDGGVAPSRYSVTGRLTRDDLDKFGIGQRAMFDGAADISVNATGDGLSIDAATLKADLTPATLAFDNVWRKNAGEAGTLTAQMTIEDDHIELSGVNISADGLDVSGDIKIANNFKLLSLNIPVMNIDNIMEGSLTGRSLDDAGLRLNLDAKSLDISPWVENFLRFDDRGDSVALTLNASINKLNFSPDLALTGAVVSYRGSEAGVVAMSMIGDLDGQSMNVEVTTPVAGGRRTLDMNLPNTGKAMRGLYNFRSLERGTLNVAATLPPAGESGPINGTADLEAFTLVNAPIFAQILSLASLQGLSDALDGGGMNFKEFHAPFTYEQNILTLDDARMGGSSIGLTASGAVDFGDQSMTLNGVLVPSYTINSMLGEIPLLGDIVVGKKGEGIFALNYSVNGPFDKTQIAVNPLSAFTPGFLRRIFDPVEPDTTTDVPEETSDPQTGD